LPHKPTPLFSEFRALDDKGDPDGIDAPISIDPACQEGRTHLRRSCQDASTSFLKKLAHQPVTHHRHPTGPENGVFVKSRQIRQRLILVDAVTFRFDTELLLQDAFEPRQQAIFGVDQSD
jgi:hypothetical protein